MVEVLDAEPALTGGIVDRWDERPVTKFERKGVAAGRSISDLCYRRRRLIQDGRHQLTQRAELSTHVAGVLHCPGEEEGALERDEDVVGQRVDVGAVRHRLPQQGGVPLPPRDRGLADRVRCAGGDELELGEDGAVQAARLRGHQLVGEALVVRQERDRSLRGVVTRLLGGVQPVPEMLQV